MNKRLRVLGLFCGVGMLVGLALAFAGEPPAGKAAADQFTGDYVGTFQSLGKGDAKPEDSAKPKSQKCGSCHAEATVQHSEKDYVLTLLVEHGKDKQGKPKMQKFTFKGQPAEKGLLFKDDNYTITVADGKITGGRKGKVIATVSLERKPASGTKPPTPGTK
jgi:hypothetical protein